MKKTSGQKFFFWKFFSSILNLFSYRSRFMSGKAFHRYVLYQSAQCNYGIYALRAPQEDVQVPGNDSVLPALHVVSVRAGSHTFHPCPGGVVDILEACGAFDPGSSPGRGVPVFMNFCMKTFSLNTGCLTCRNLPGQFLPEPYVACATRAGVQGC